MNKLFVGTSGWSYEWNPGGLEWYVNNSKLNAIELNMSYYCFPNQKQIITWSKFDNIRWCIKVNRTITHMYKMNENSYEYFKTFKKLFEPLENKIDFYLFQFPKQVKPDILNNIEKFLNEFHINKKFALEARSSEWFNDSVYKKCKELNISLVSIDAPFARKIVKTTNTIYLRMHGRKEWYHYNYNEKELNEVYEEVKKQNAKQCFIFFNNNHNMLDNAQIMANKLNIKSIKTKQSTLIF